MNGSLRMVVDANIIQPATNKAAVNAIPEVLSQGRFEAVPKQDSTRAIGVANLQILKEQIAKVSAS